MPTDNVFRALADPQRRRILRIIGDGELAVGEIGRHFDLTGPSLSHHLASLKGAGLVLSRRKGQQILYSVNTTVVQDLLAHVFDLFGVSPEEQAHR